MADQRAGGRGRAGRRGSYHAGLDMGAVVDAAVGLSRGAGLTAWSLRDLARELGVAPSVIYHHVGGRELLSHHVVERVLGMAGLPTVVMPWRQWFREALFPLRPVLAAYPGTARWLLLHGPAVKGVAPVVDAGITSLRRDGFGRNAATAYSALTNMALMTIAATDDRVLHEGDAPRDHASLIRSLEGVAEGSVGVSEMTRDLLVQFTGSPQDVVAAQDRYYRFVLERLMDGLAAWLETGMAD